MRENGTTSRSAALQGEEKDREAFLRAMNAMGAHRHQDTKTDEEGDPSARSRAGRMRQLKRGTVRIEAELDLHGLTREEAVFRLKHCIADCIRRGMATILVITGKGVNSPEGPVLREAVPAWLRGPGRELVSECLPAPRDKGGSGAFVVFLRKR